MEQHLAHVLGADYELSGHMCKHSIRMKMDSWAILPVSPISLLLVSLLHDADLLSVTVTKVLQLPLAILSCYAKFHFGRKTSMMSSTQTNAML